MTAIDRRSNNPVLAMCSASQLLTVGDHLASNVCDLKIAPFGFGIFPDSGLATHLERGYTTTVDVWRDRFPPRSVLEDITHEREARLNQIRRRA